LLKAIEKYKGKHGMEALVNTALHHPWEGTRDEARKTFERITGKAFRATGKEPDKP
jgi:hypothetical protein